MALGKKLKEMEEEQTRAHAKLVKLRSYKEDLIEELMDFQRFKKLMDAHDKVLYPAQFS